MVIWKFLEYNTMPATVEWRATMPHGSIKKGGEFPAFLDGLAALSQRRINGRNGGSNPC